MIEQPMNNDHSHLQRRSFLRVGGLSSLLAMLPWVSQHAVAAELDSAAPGRSKSTQENKIRKCILVWLDGGPSHLEMFDPKPEAPVEVRGPFESIRTKIASVQFSECLPRLATKTDDLAIIRSMTSPLGEHNLGTHYMLTGYKPNPAIDYPSFGSVYSHLLNSGTVKPQRANTASSLPTQVAIPNHRVGGSNFSAAGFLGSLKRPFEVGGDPAKPNFQVTDLDWFPGLDSDRIRRREHFLNRLEEQLSGGSENQLDPQFKQAFDLLQNPQAKKAFDMDDETAKTRERYGFKSIGQSCLLARRLVERGVSFVTVNNKGWDTHDRLVDRLKDGYTGARKPVGLIPSMDMAVSSLIEDLKERGLWDETVIVVMGEFGRTPKLNVNSGRDHWPRVFSVMLAGGPIRGGTIYGESDAKGESPRRDPVTPSQFIATLYQALGVDPGFKLQSPEGRPISIAAGAKPVSELLA